MLVMRLMWLDVDGESGDKASSDPEPEPMRKGLGKGKVKNEGKSHPSIPQPYLDN
jgi:hypothetical protein